jgi:hypothetical protein
VGKHAGVEVLALTEAQKNGTAGAAPLSVGNSVGQLTASFKALPAENLGTFFAPIWIVAPVWGLRPMRALR